MKNMKKLIPALAMLVLSAVMMSTASFAWFSMNQSVSVTGISVDTVAPVYVSIRTTGTSTWGTKVSYTDNNTVLLPADVNVVDGELTTFLVVDGFETTTGGGIVGAGKENEDLLTTQVKEASADGTVEGATAKAFVKFSYDFTLQNATGLTTYNLYLASMKVAGGTDTGDDMMDCLRIAVVHKTADSANVVGIYAPVEGDEGSDYYPLEKKTEDDTVTYVAGSTAVEAIVGNNTAFAYDAENGVLLPVLEENGYITLEIYIWFEGQDGDCVNAAANGALGIEFIFETKANV